MLLQNGTIYTASPLRLTGNISNSIHRSPFWGQWMSIAGHFDKTSGIPVGYREKAIIKPYKDYGLAATVRASSSALAQIIVGATISITLSPLIYPLEGSFTYVGDSAGVFDIPMVTMTGEGYSVFGEGIFEVPVIRFEGTGLVGAVGEGVFDIPVLQMDVEAQETIEGEGQFVIPALRITGSGFGGVVGSGVFDIPVLVMSGQQSKDIEGFGVFDLPPLRFSGYGDVSHIQKLYRGVVMNASHFGITEYHNYPFNSLAYFNGVFLGANGNGIHRLDGKNDNGVYIHSRVRAKTEDVWEEFKKKPREVWLTGRSDGHLMLVLVLDEKDAYEDRFEVVDPKIHEQRVKLPKGIKNRFMAFEIQNVSGSDFSIDQLRIMGDKILRRR